VLAREPPFEVTAVHTYMKTLLSQVWDLGQAGLARLGLTLLTPGMRTERPHAGYPGIPNCWSACRERVAWILPNTRSRVDVSTGLWGARFDYARDRRLAILWQRQRFCNSVVTLAAQPSSNPSSGVGMAL
jgi:hypothetical protein